MVEAGTAILVQHPGAAIGYAYLALLAALSYVVVIVAVVSLQLRENHRAFSLPRAVRVRAALRAIPVPTLSSMLVATALVLRGGAVAAAFVPNVQPTSGVEFNGPATESCNRFVTTFG